MSKRLLMIAWFNNVISPATVFEHLHNIRKYSRYKIDLFNLASYELYTKFTFFERKKKTEKLALSNYDGLIIHNTTAYDPSNVYRVSESFDIDISKFQGIKVLMKQDEVVHTNLTKQLIKDWEFNLLFTCVPNRDIDVIYPTHEFPNLKKFHVETGYITEEMKNSEYIHSLDRPIDISYRGMKLPYNFGSLAYEKFLIGENFKKICSQYGLKYDISCEISDRIYGKAWIDFLASSKCALAVESGGSIYDFDGQVVKKTKSYEEAHGEVEFEEIYENVLKEYDGKYIYNAISPRHFEAAYTRTVLMMHEGEYSGIFKPNQHYIPIKKDYSNIEDAIGKFKDYDNRLYLTNNAYYDIIQNPKYSYRTFVNMFDEKINDLMG